MMPLRWTTPSRTQAAIRVPVRVHRTALVLHALPAEYEGRREQYVEEVRGELLTEIHRRGMAGSTLQ